MVPLQNEVRTVMVVLLNALAPGWLHGGKAMVHTRLVPLTFEEAPPRCRPSIRSGVCASGGAIRKDTMLISRAPSVNLITSGCGKT